MTALSDNQMREVISIGSSFFNLIGDFVFDCGNATSYASGFILLDGGNATSTSFFTIDFGGA